MKRILTLLLVALTFAANAQNYVGVQSCQMCHQGTLRTFPGFNSWKATLHSKIHLLPSTETMKGDYSQTVSMGAAYGNATVTFRTSGADYFIQLNPVGGSQVEYKVDYTYGGGWKQRYLVKIGLSYYIPPVQWNLKKYLDNSTGNWAAYNPQNWFTSTGALKPQDNVFRAKSWDKNCAGCHVVPGNNTNTVTVNVSGTDTSWTYGWANSSSADNIVVGCESCHGHPSAFAGPVHVNKLTDLSYDRKLDVCGQCHFRGTSKGKVFEYPYDEVTGKTYPVGEDLAGYVTYKGGLWPDGKTSKQHHQQSMDFKYAKHFNSNFGITCVTCHDPHQETAQSHQLKQDFNSLTPGIGCVSCHADKAAETGGINNHTKHSQSISQCVNCHMTQNATTARAYDISNHSFMPIRPNLTITYANVTGGQINTCAVSCHRNGQGTRGTGYGFGITDATLTDWSESTDIALADTLWRYYQAMWGIVGLEKEESGVPTEFALNQNFPNPFNPTTTISFNVAKSANMRLEIFNAAGELVNILVNQELAPGTYKYQWDSRAAAGYTVPSGIYFYRLVSDNVNLATKKMILMK
ncbi:hypothetical protein MASR1M107_32480 [Ignavibacteriales bacterium]